MASFLAFLLDGDGFWSLVLLGFSVDRIIVGGTDSGDTLLLRSCIYRPTPGAVGLWSLLLGLQRAAALTHHNTRLSSPRARRVRVQLFPQSLPAPVSCKENPVIRSAGNVFLPASPTILLKVLHGTNLLCYLPCQSRYFPRTDPSMLVAITVHATAFFVSPGDRHLASNTLLGSIA